jgi:hypothetical protein
LRPTAGRRLNDLAARQAWEWRKFESAASPGIRVTCPWRMQRSLTDGVVRLVVAQIGPWMAPLMRLSLGGCLLWIF